MKRTVPLSAIVLAAALACGGEEAADADAPADTTVTAEAPGGAADPAATDAQTTTEGEATTATTASATGAPAPPGGYAVESRPAEGGQLARIEYASPSTVAEAAAFYDGQIQASRRVEVDIAGDNLVAYGLSANTTLGPATTAQDIERLLGQRTESMVVISPWQVDRDDPLLRDLRDAGLADQADQLMNTKSKVTVIYAVRP